MLGDGHDSRVRLAAFSFLTELSLRAGEVLAHADLSRGFEYEGRRVPLLGPQGIFKPAVLPKGSVPLTITTAPEVAGKARPYDDDVGPDGLLRYKYRGTDPQHHENVALRRAMVEQTPVVYLHGILKGQYLAFWPVFIVGDDAASLTFTVAVDDPAAIDPTVDLNVAEDARRSYYTQLTRRRLHQHGFRARVLKAYRTACAMCRLRHADLLDAAHIVPDSHPLGEPVVPNGLALCKLHHAAFDRNILGIRPDLVINVQLDVLEEVDGPMLRHGLQELDGKTMTVPRRPVDRPSPDLLEVRFEEFRKAG